LASDSPGSTIDPAANAEGSIEYSVEGRGLGADSLFTGACEAPADDCDPCGWYLEIDSPGNTIGSGRCSNLWSERPSCRSGRS
jgi:hypothetical protein